MSEQQVKSRERVTAHGEVFTAAREVNAMLDLVKNETERLDSRFLEPACGDGNFLVEILRRKLAVAARESLPPGRKTPNPADYDCKAVLAVMSIYGVELLPDNAAACRERLFDLWKALYRENCHTEAPENSTAAVRYVLEKNILCGDALTLKQANGEPIVFAEWSRVTGTKVKRRDFCLDELLEGHRECRSLFMQDWDYDAETKAFIPKPIGEYPPVDYWKVQEYDECRSNPQSRCFVLSGKSQQ